ARATPKRLYYMIHPEGRRLFELGLSPVELAFVGASGKSDITMVRELHHQHGNGWPAHWLRERGQGKAAEVWESYR
ncbi:MAG: conjugal transfer protein TrbE, partial [Betaproteobacteria bacterium]|nr:conjugal transfer protein TrbE [Betaproteobacteria bacterium]